MSLCRDQPVPLYYQVEVVLRRAIERGEMADGRVPTEEELVKRYQVSRITVRTALRRLEEDGLIERHRGRGTFVRRDAARKIERRPDHLLGFEEDLRRQGVVPEVRVLSIEQIEPPAEVASALVRPITEWVYRVRRLGRANDEPLWVESRYYPQDVGAKMVERDLAGASVTRMLEDTLAVRITGVRVFIESGAANARQAQALGVRTGHPLLVNQFAFYDAHGRVLEVLRAAFRGDRYAYAFDLAPRQAAHDGDAWAASPNVLLDLGRWPVPTGCFRPPDTGLELADIVASQKEGIR